MWTSTLDSDPKRVLFTRLIGRFYRDIYFSSISPLQVQNLPRQPLPTSNWVRVRNRLAGISGNDLQLIYSATQLSPTNQNVSYPGQELVGEVIEIGDDVQHLNVGDRVALRYRPNCLSLGIQPLCRSCSNGNYNLCENSFRAEQPTLGGGWSEEILLNEQQLFLLPGTLSDEQAVMLEASAVPLHAVLRHLPRAGERVLVIGAGTLGLLTLQILRTLVPQCEVSVLARHPFQVEQATRLGAAHIIYPQDADTGVQRATGARLQRGTFGRQILHGGYDVIYDTIGHKETIQQGLRWARTQATIVLIGTNLHTLNIDLSPLWYEEINLIGSASHGLENWPLATTEHRSTFQVAVELMERGRIHPEQLITHHFALNNYKHALATAKDKTNSRAIKVVFDYSLLPASAVPNIKTQASRLQRPQIARTNRNVAASTAASPLVAYTNVPATELPLTPRAPSIQTTPPVAALDEDAMLNAMSYVDDDDDEVTAVALPVISKQHRAMPRTSTATENQPARPQQVLELTAVPTTDSTTNDGDATISFTKPRYFAQLLDEPVPASPFTSQTPTGSQLVALPASEVEPVQAAEGETPQEPVAASEPQAEEEVPTNEASTEMEPAISGTTIDEPSVETDSTISPVEIATDPADENNQALPTAEVTETDHASASSDTPEATPIDEQPLSDSPPALIEYPEQVETTPSDDRDNAAPEPAEPVRVAEPAEEIEQASDEPTEEEPVVDDAEIIPTKYVTANADAANEVQTISSEETDNTIQQTELPAPGFSDELAEASSTETSIPSAAEEEAYPFVPAAAENAEQTPEVAENGEEVEQEETDLADTPPFVERSQTLRIHLASRKHKRR